MFWLNLPLPHLSIPHSCLSPSTPSIFPSTFILSVSCHRLHPSSLKPLLCPLVCPSLISWHLRTLPHHAHMWKWEARIHIREGMWDISLILFAQVVSLNVFWVLPIFLSISVFTLADPNSSHMSTTVHYLFTSCWLIPCPYFWHHGSSKHGWASTSVEGCRVLCQPLCFKKEQLD